MDERTRPTPHAVAAALARDAKAKQELGSDFGRTLTGQIALDRAVLVNALVEARKDLAKAEARFEKELAEVKRERDLAIAHDRQPYPTADAYERVCAALERHRARADKAEAERDALKAARCSCDGDPIECSHEAARGQAEEDARQLRAMYDELSKSMSQVGDRLARRTDQHEAAVRAHAAERDAHDKTTAELEKARQTAKDFGGMFVLLSNLVRDAFRKGETDPIAALDMLGDYLSEVCCENEGGLAEEEFFRIRAALRNHKSEAGEARREATYLREVMAGMALLGGDDAVGALRALTGELGKSGELSADQVARVYEGLDRQAADRE